MTGCAALHPIYGIPPCQVPQEYLAPSRAHNLTISQSLLSQTTPTQHIIDRGDVLGIYIEGVLGNPGEAPPVNFPVSPDMPPTIGFPLQVRDDGTISMPLYGSVDVRGMTLRQLEEHFRQYYIAQGLLQQGRDKIIVTLQKARQVRVLVMRQESAGSGAATETLQIGTLNLGKLKRGTGKTVYLPAYQNDVLHALAETGGLPGLDAENAIYIIRNQATMQNGGGCPPQYAPQYTPQQHDPQQYMPQYAPTPSYAPGYGYNSESGLPAQQVPLLGHNVPQINDVLKTAKNARPFTVDESPLLEVANAKTSGQHNKEITLAGYYVESVQARSFNSPVNQAVNQPNSAMQVPYTSQAPSTTQDQLGYPQQGYAVAPSGMNQSGYGQPVYGQQLPMQQYYLTGQQGVIPDAVAPVMPPVANLNKPAPKNLNDQFNKIDHSNIDLKKDPYYQIDQNTNAKSLPPSYFDRGQQPQQVPSAQNAPSGSQVMPPQAVPAPVYTAPVAPQMSPQYMAPQQMAPQMAPAQMAPNMPPPAYNQQPMLPPPAFNQQMPMSVPQQQPIAPYYPQPDNSNGMFDQTWNGTTQTIDPHNLPPNIIRIPIRLSPGEQLNLRPEDVILNDGDIVFIESQPTETFYTGGLLGGGQYTIPRDYDLDVLEAISIAQSQNRATSGTRGIGGVSAINGDVTISASKIYILRKLVTGGQIVIKVDLYDAINDPSQRVLIMPGDMVMLRYTCIEGIGAFIERNLLEGALFGVAAAQLTTN